MPQTLVAFHAHPDDESIVTGGVLAQAADSGRRVVLVVATRGELGTAGPGDIPARPRPARPPRPDDTPVAPPSRGGPWGRAPPRPPGGPPPAPPAPPSLDLGVDPARITTTVDVSDVVDRKRAALAAHASQVDETSFFLAMPVEAFRTAFRYEWFIHRGAPPGTQETSLLDG